MSVKPIRLADQKRQTSAEQYCRFARFNLNQVKAVMQGNEKERLRLCSRNQGLRSATGSACSGAVPDRVRRERYRTALRSRIK